MTCQGASQSGAGVVSSDTVERTISARPKGGSNSTLIKSCGGERTGRRQDEAPADEPTDAAAAAAAAAFIADVLPSRALRDLGAQILAKDAEDPDPETLMRRLQIEFHRVETERA